MDRGSVKDGDVDTRSEPALPSDEVSLCQYSGLTRSRASHTKFVALKLRDALLQFVALTSVVVKDALPEKRRFSLDRKSVV